VAALLRSGVPILFDAPAVAALLEPLGLRGEEVGRTTASLSGWTKEFDRHVFLVASAALDRPAESTAGAVSATAPFAAAFGTGPWSYVRTTVTDTGGAASLETELRSLVDRPVPQMRIALRAQAGRGEVLINRRRMVSTEGAAAGAAVLVIDPEMGVVVDAAQFPRDGAEVVTWRLWRLVEGPR
jgi:hypothetical protein